MTRATTPPMTAHAGTRARPGAGGGVGASAGGGAGGGQFHPTSSIMRDGLVEHRAGLVHRDGVDLHPGPVGDHGRGRHGGVGGELAAGDDLLLRRAAM